MHTIGEDYFSWIRLTPGIVHCPVHCGAPCVIAKVIMRAGVPIRVALSNAAELRVVLVQPRDGMHHAIEEGTTLLGRIQPKMLVQCLIVVGQPTDNPPPKFIECREVV